jgi:flagellar protein FliS
MNAYLNSYQKNQVATASREQILIMLYDGAIRFTRQAIFAIGEGDVSGKVTGIQKAMAIVMEFRNTLDHQIGGDMAANLDALYDYMIRNMLQANMKNEVKPLEEVVGLLTDLRETWMEAIETVRQEQKVETKAANGDYKPLSASF